MAFSVVLDACVLYPASLRDTLLRFASRDFFIPVGSARILDEVDRNLVANGVVSPERIGHLRGKLETVFADAWAPDAAIAAIEDAMTNHAKDRHVVAAAVVSEAQTIVTHNLRDFPEDSVAPFGIQVEHPDAFLLGLHGLEPGLSRTVLEAQAAALVRPPVTVEDLLKNLKAAGVPDFAAVLRAEVDASAAG